jgi:hypothetical protein
VARWKEEQPQRGVVRGELIGKVNSEQKKLGTSERQIPNAQLDSKD